MFSSRVLLIADLALLVLLALAGLTLSAAAQPLQVSAGLSAAPLASSPVQSTMPYTLSVVAYLPYVVKEQVPDVPVLTVPDWQVLHGGDFPVSWTPAARAARYTLQEARDPMSTWNTIYSGPAVAFNVTGRAAGSWYYRVKASNQSGDSGWSQTGMTNVATGASGHVRYAGTPWGGIVLELRRYDPGSGFITVATASSDNAGAYAFNLPDWMLPPPVAGRFYYVRYANGSSGNGQNPSFLSTAWSRSINPFQSGTFISGLDFEIGNIVLNSPSPGATVHVPVTFSWTPRVPQTDSYIHELFDLNSGAYWDSAPLGRVASYTLSSLPSGVNTGTPYGWAMLVVNAQGDGGASYYYRTVIFSSGMLAQAPDAALAVDFLNRTVVERVEADKVGQR